MKNEGKLMNPFEENWVKILMFLNKKGYPHEIKTLIKKKTF